MDANFIKDVSVNSIIKFLEVNEVAELGNYRVYSYGYNYFDEDFAEAEKQMFEQDARLKINFILIDDENGNTMKQKLYFSNQNVWKYNYENNTLVEALDEKTKQLYQNFIGELYYRKHPEEQAKVA